MPRWPKQNKNRFFLLNHRIAYVCKRTQCMMAFPVNIHFFGYQSYVRMYIPRYVGIKFESSKMKFLANRAKVCRKFFH
jgi:hypothetical protein